MTLDHITPLFFNGKDCVENLQCTCKVCNEFKSHILPEEFAERIMNIFCFQMKRRFGKSLKWKIVHRLLSRMLEASNWKKKSRSEKRFFSGNQNHRIWICESAAVGLIQRQWKFLWFSVGADWYIKWLEKSSDWKNQWKDNIV